MRLRTLLVLLFSVALAATAAAQTKISGTATCKADPSTPVAVTDVPNHAFRWASPSAPGTSSRWGAFSTKTGVSTSLDEINGDALTFRGYHVATMANGGTTTSSFTGKGMSKDGKPLSGEGTWAFTSGTGKYKGIKGKGTFKGKGNADGSMTYQIDGEYSLP